MRRRRFLASAALSVTALAAGCTSDGPTDDATATTSSTTTATTTTTTSETTTATTRTQVDVSEAWVDRSFTYLHAGAHIKSYTVTGDGPVFVFAATPGEERPVLELDGERHAPAEELPGGASPQGVFYGRDGGNVVAYRFPGAVEASAGRVGTHEFDAGALDALADPPRFRVENVDIADSVQSSSEATSADVPITIEVANDGGAAGTFRVAATSSQYSGYVRAHTDVASGETVTFDFAAPLYADDEDTATVTWGSGTRSETVAVES